MTMLFYHLFLALIPLAVIGAIILFLFRKSLYSRLSTRIAVLVFASGPAVLIVVVVFRDFIQEAGLRFGISQTSQIALLAVCGSVALGLLAARYVQRPMRQFNDAIDSLERSNYTVQLHQTGVREFDEVFAKFNNLTKRLHHEEKLRKDLVSDTSHELNTPLTVMIGQLTAIQEGKYPMTKERVAILKEQAERLAELVQQLDTYTKARVSDDAEPEDINLKQLCEELLKHFSLELKQKGITARLNIAGDYTIRANRSALRQILTNLLQNSLRYSQATELVIEVSQHKILFSDNGKGVPTNSLPYLFERFYRVDKSRSRATGGLGLGLAIVKELAESQGWIITAAAGHPGLKFVLKLSPDN